MFSIELDAHAPMLASRPMETKIISNIYKCARAVWQDYCPKDVCTRYCYSDRIL